VSFYKTQPQLSVILRLIADGLPSRASLTSFEYRTDKRSIQLMGFAPTTEDLLAFRTSLEKNAMFSNFFFPPSNWVDPVDIDFSFTFEVL